MKKTRILLCLSIMASTLLVAATPVPHGTALPSKVLKTQSETITMEVESVDYPGGTVTLRGRGFERRTIHVNKNLHNLRKIGPGDWLIITTHEEAVVTTATGGEPYTVESEDIVAGPKSKKPTLRSVERTILQAKIVSIDQAHRTMTVEGPTGRRRTVRVKEDVKHFENLKPGDTVKVSITRITDIKVRPMQ
ncbi:hypothetical protein [Hydrogenimonas urashimensis]|uniref:hypothetical protein n=1 Tax=Hydrogenimonas urashimensis TaxID=2740515 RepID=UPI0019168061|nr:hypothetical protein [Hydrogenimonas urashimensis]